MTIGFSPRIAMSACALCLTGVLAFTPIAATATTGSDPSTQVHPHPGAPQLPDISALSWLVADTRTGEVLAAHDAHRRLPPASTLKTLFALTVLPTLPGGLRHRVTEEDLAGIGEGSSLVGVEEGHTYRVADLWRGVFLNSGNDAVHVLAALNGGWDVTAARMQAKARSLGALDTQVISPDGYDTDGQVSSAFDLAVFGRAGLRNPDFARYCSTAEAQFPGDGSSYGIQNTNRLLTGNDGVEPYPGLIGVKNGYTTHAGNTLVAAARRGERSLVVTVMNPQAGGGFTVYEEARELLDWGFAAAGRVDPVGSLDASPARPKPRPRPGPAAVPVAATAVADEGPGWADTAAIVAAAVLGAGAVVLALRFRGARSPRT
jgi:D-alanyl-D-alanine carboxypeptidase (penicillin-binding protein 5/6)